MSENETLEGTYNNETSFFDHDDIFDEEESENPGKLKKFISNIPPQYRSLALTGGLVLVLFVVCVTGFQLLYGGPPEELAARTAGATTNNADIPINDITQTSILGDNSVAEKTRRAVEKIKIDQADKSNTSAVADLDLSKLTSENVASLKSEQESLSEPERAQSKTQKLVNDATRESMNKSGMLDQGPYDSNVPLDSAYRGYNFQQLLADTATDTSNWDDTLSQAISLTPFESHVSIASYPEEEAASPTPLEENDSNSRGDSSLNEKASYHAKLTETHYAELIKPINTDDGGLVVARIISGPLRGTRIVGTAEILENKRLGVAFDRARYRGVTNDGFNAIALSFENLRDSLPAEVDNHYLSKYIPFILANMGGFWADSLISTLEQDKSDGSTTTTTGGLEKTSDQLKYSAGKTLHQFLPQISEMVNRKPTLKKDRGEVFLVMFLNDYTFSS